LKLQEIVKASILSTDGKNTYSELSVGVQRLGFRVDFVTGFSNQKKLSAGIRVGIKFNNKNMRAKTLILSICFIGLMLQARAFEYPSKSVTLKTD